jgi:D-glycero-D-manno-heptose 1,7-bisphosphate phosphatase
LDEFQVNLEAREPMRLLKEAGFVLVATTNQPGLSRGHLSRRELDRMHDILRRTLPLDDILVCPHDEMDRCPCRKPMAGLMTEAAFKWQLDLDRSYVVSDKWQDARAAHNVGCTSLMLQSQWVGNCHHDFVLGRIAEVAEKILQFHASPVLMMDQA